MAGIRQLQLAFVPGEDRLLLRVRTSAGEELRFWLTRRYVKLLYPLLARALESDPEVRRQTSAEARREMLSFRREQALCAADFSRPFQDGATRLPLGAAPVLLARARLAPRAGGVHLLALHPEQGAGVELTVDIGLLHSLSRLLAETAARAQWDLTLEPAATADPATARTIN